MPFAVHYDDGVSSRTVYFNTLGDNFAPHISADNVRWYEMLEEALERKTASSRQRDQVLAV